MYPTDPSISSYGSNPTTPVNSPPPLTSQQQQAAAAAAAAAVAQQHSSVAPSIHGSSATAGSSSGGVGSSATASSAAAAAAAAAAVAAAGSPWQQINPVINNGAGPAGAAGSAAAAVAAAAALNGLPNGSYAPELVHRGLQHMVIAKMLSSVSCSTCACSENAWLSAAPWPSNFHLNSVEVVLFIYHVCCVWIVCALPFHLIIYLLSHRA